MTVSNSFLVDVKVNLNTTAIQTENFNSCMLLGVMATQTTPYQCPPTSWGTDPFKVYASAIAFNAEFDPIIAAATTVGDTLQTNRLVWLQEAVTAFFAQDTNPTTVTIMKMDPPTALTNYSTVLAALTAANNNWYGFSICDNIPVNQSVPPIPPNFSRVLMSIQVSAAMTIPAGTVVSSPSVTSTSPYILLSDYVVSAVGTVLVPFHSLDTVTIMPASSLTVAKYNNAAVSGITSVTNPSVSAGIAMAISSVPVSIVANGIGTIPAGSNCVATGGPTPTSPYLVLNDFVITTIGAYNITCYSLDIVTVIPLVTIDEIRIAGALFPFILYPTANLFTNTVYIPPSSLGLDPPNFSEAIVSITVSAAVTLPAGTIISSPSITPTSPYILLSDKIFLGPELASVTFYSLDTTTVMPASSLTTVEYNGSPIPLVTSAINPASSTALAMAISSVPISIVANALGTIPAGSNCIATAGPTPTSPYLNLSDVSVATIGAFNITCYSLDITTTMPLVTIDDIRIGGATFPFILYPTANLFTNTVYIPTPVPPPPPPPPSPVPVEGVTGILTPITGVTAALTNLRGSDLNNPKILFLDSSDFTVAGQVQASNLGTEDLMFCYHSQNLQVYTSSSASLAAANLGQYFTNLFSPGVGAKPLSSSQIQGVDIDQTITTANIGKPGDPGNSNSLINWNNNVYAGFGGPPGIGLMQYGFMSSSTSSKQVYLDQVVGADYLRLTTQADLASFIINQQAAGGILYSDFGIQQIVSVFRKSIQKAVAQNIIQPPNNSSFVYATYGDLLTQDITNRVYKNLAFNGKFLSRIQQISVNINLSL